MDIKSTINLVIIAALKAGITINEIYNSNFNVEFKADNSPLTEADKKANHVITKILEKTELPVLSEEGKETPFNERKKWNKFWMVDPLDGTKEFVKRNGEFTVNIALIANGIPVLGVVYAPVLDCLYLGRKDIGAFKIKNASAMDIQNNGWKKYSEKLPSIKQNSSFKIVASRSHLSEETEAFINEQKNKYPEVEIVSKGSSLKLCMIAEGSADVYPRFAPTMEWDTAAGHAVVKASGGKVIQWKGKKEMVYNKENLLNPWFIASC